MANQTELLNVSYEMKSDDDRQNLCELESAGELYSSSLDTTEELYSSSATDAYRSCGGFKQKQIKIKGCHELHTNFSDNPFYIYSCEKVQVFIGVSEFKVSSNSVR